MARSVIKIHNSITTPHSHTDLLISHTFVCDHYQLYTGNLSHTATSHILYKKHSHLVLVVTATSHPPPAITLSPRYINPIIFIPLHILFDLHLNCLSNISSNKVSWQFLGHQLTPAHPPWIHLTHLPHTTWPSPSSSATCTVQAYP